MRDFHSSMLSWFQAYGRDLPWRHSPTPYQVWVSEIMLQQTQVVTVIPYYQRWMERFPNVYSLAEANIDDVLTLWAGLGYYRRARYLHEGARVIVKDYDGKFPQTPDKLHKIPGIGPYTAGAIASFAFGQNVPAVDGNAERVLSRYFGIFGDLTRGEAKKRLHETATTLAKLGNAPSINQAIMDLGASCCARTAQCATCPVHANCYALTHGMTDALPQKKQATDKYDEYRVALKLTLPDQKLLLARRKPHILLGGLWEYPMITLQRGKRIAPPNLRMPRQNLWQTWLKSHHPHLELNHWKTTSNTIEHIFTHIHMRVILDTAQLQTNPTSWPEDNTYDTFCTFTAAEIQNLATSSLMQKLLNI